MNKITSSTTAIVNGKETGLAGCHGTDCDRPCIRQDKELEKVIDYSEYHHDGFGCPGFIQAK